MRSRDSRRCQPSFQKSTVGGLFLVSLLAGVPALGQHSENATILSPERATGEGGGPFTGLGQTAAANLFTGDASLSVPIQVPPGRGQATPALSLAYSSSGGDGPFGVGWGIAIGSVLRSTKHGVPRCVEDDEFTLSLPGANVDLVQDAGAPSTYYASVDEAYVEATADEANNTWTVRDRAGRTYRFGTDPTARSWTGQDVFMDETASGCGFTAIWSLTQIEDPNGNTIDFLYTNTGNAPLIQEIRYGANPSALLSEHPFKIAFSRTTRTYSLESHRLGVSHVLSELISQIDVSYRPSLGAAYVLARTYGLSYTESPFGGRAFLDAITATGLPTRTFSYTEPSARFVGTATRPDPFGAGTLTESHERGNALHRIERTPIDMNGDAIADAVDVDFGDTGSWSV